MQRDEPVVNSSNGRFFHVSVAYSTNNSFKIKEKISGERGDKWQWYKRNVEIILTLKYVGSFFGELFKIPSIKWEIYLDLNWSNNSIIKANNANQETTF